VTVEQRQRPEVARRARRRRPIIEYGLIIIGAILLALLVQAFVVKPYRIPSDSMLDTLRPSDRVLVNRLVYHFRKPRRGDIIVFDSKALGKTLIKRIIGLPGEEISLGNGHVYINGHPLREPYVRVVNGVQTPSEPFTGGEPWSLTQPYKIPSGHYFMMGDNRLYSDDSRDWGTVSNGEIIGEAFFRYWPLRRVGTL
jgi:signal peptidase I